MLAEAVLNRDIFDPIAVWAERDLRARLILDDDLGVTWRNAAAVELIDEVDVFSIGDSLTPFNSRQRDAFREFIRASDREVSSLCIPSSDNDHILCTAVSLGGDRRSRATGVTLRKASGTAAIGTATLETAFSLTPSERKIVETLFNGQTAEQIGTGLHLSVGTVRVHIRHIYEKLAVCSREAMFHKLMPFMLVR